MPKPDRSDEPREGLFRMVPNVLARADVSDGNTLTGLAAVFNTPAQIESYSGTFTEQIQPGAFKKTITERTPKVMFNHGMDPQIGMKPLGKPAVLQERKDGLYTETPLDDTSYNRDLKASIASGAIDGMSFQFDVLQEEWNEDKTERTIKEVRLYEFGPVTWPAYETTSAGIRSKGVYGNEAAPPKPPGRDDAPDDEGRRTPEQQARNRRMAEKVRAAGSLEKEVPQK